jgi:hypothetical protein
MYKITGADGKEYGPVSMEQVRRWIRENRVNAQTKVQPEGATEWQLLGSLPEFADALAAKTASTAPPTPDSLLAHDYEFNISECLGRSWELLTNNFGPIFGGTAICLLIILGLGLMGSIPFIGVFFSIASMIITGPLMGGVYYFLLKNVRGQSVEVAEVFDGFRRGFGSLLACNIVMGLLIGISSLPGAAMLIIAIILMVKAQTVVAGLLILALLGFIVMIVPSIYLSVSWFFAMPLIMDKGLDFWPAMEVSRKMIGKHWGTTFAFLIVCGLINFAGLCACCVGIFFSTPWTFTAFMVAYDRMFPATGRPAA